MANRSRAAALVEYVVTLLRKTGAEERRGGGKIIDGKIIEELRLQDMQFQRGNLRMLQKL